MATFPEETKTLSGKQSSLSQTPWRRHSVCLTEWLLWELETDTQSQAPAKSLSPDTPFNSFKRAKKSCLREDKWWLGPDRRLSRQEKASALPAPADGRNKGTCSLVI